MNIIKLAISNDERREVAKKLRELPSDVYEVEGQWKTEGISTDCHDQTDYYLIHDVLLECLPAEHMHPCDYEELHARLADPINSAARPSSSCALTGAPTRAARTRPWATASDASGRAVRCSGTMTRYAT